MTSNLIASDPGKARAEMHTRQRGRSAGEAADQWPQGCMAFDPTKPGRTEERCCRRATRALKGVPLCDRHWHEAIGGQT